MSSGGLALAPPARRVVLYRNGDPFFPGRRFVVSQRRFLTFEGFLNEVTKSICAPLAVRNLYTPRHGHRLTTLGDLQDGGRYVAAGSERFKRLKEFWNHLGCKRPLRSSSPTLNPALVVPPPPSHALGCFPHSVFRNGDLLSPPFPLLLPRSSPLHWDTLLATLTEKTTLSSGAVHQLCRLDRTSVSAGEELLSGHYYVAVGKEEYKKLPYMELLVPQDSTSRALRYV
ncbi:DCD2B protein, partial [Brachypteracias leptosomus]|nr:DCD2B protein [Brachypteracias leptosomus]